MKKYLTLCICLMLFSCLLSTCAFCAEEPQAEEAAAVAKVIASIGTVTAKQPEAPVRELANGSPIYSGDVIKTKSASKVQIQFMDFTIISIGPKATMTIDNFFFEEGNSGSQCDTSVLEGAFKIVGGKISKMAPDQIKVKTPSATIGIRGTMGVGSADDGSTTMIFMGGGAISVRGVATGASAGADGPAGPGGPGDLGLQVLTGQPGMGVTTQQGFAPPPPHMFDPNFIFGLLDATSVPGAGDDDDDGGAVGYIGDDDDGDDDDGGTLPALPDLPDRPFDLSSIDPGGEQGVKTYNFEAYGLGVLEKAYTGSGFNFSLWYPLKGEIEDFTSKGGWLHAPGDYPGAWNNVNIYPSVPVNPDGIYNNIPEFELFTDTLVFDGNPHDVNVMVSHDNLGEFAYMLRASAEPMEKEVFRQNLGTPASVEYGYYGMTYAGLPSGDLPDNQVLRYGALGTFSENLGNYFVVHEEPPASFDVELGAAGVAVNTENQRWIGVFDNSGTSLHDGSHIAFGSVDDEGILTGQVFLQEVLQDTPDIDDYEPDYITGEVQGQLFGHEYQGIGLHGSGTGNIQYPQVDAMTDWDVIAAAYLDKDKTESATAGVITHDSGFVAGVALDGQGVVEADNGLIYSGHILLGEGDDDDDDDEISGPTFWHNTNPEAVSLTLNDSSEGGAQGLVHGNLGADEYTADGVATGNSMALILGDDESEENSAFVTPDLYASLVTDGVVDNHTLMADGSYIVAYPIAELEDKPWISMGGLAVHYADEGGQERILPRLFSFFVSGTKAEIDEVMYANMRSNHVVGYYHGPALGAYLTGNNLYSLSGTNDATVDFNSEQINSIFNLSDNQAISNHVLTAAGGVNQNGFNGSITGWTVNGAAVNLNGNSQMNGGFYGSASATEAPASIGGNFSASHSTGEGGAISGTFVGNSYSPAD
ncbi:MAG: FecR domain-containing protein [Planctomycetes bacterium]|nr:FecR domain-containing protein [Planctomycetota bacterium]